MKRPFAAVALAAATLLAVGPAAAAPPGRDGAFNFRLGGFFPTADSDFWSMNEDFFSLDDSDFNNGIAGVGYSASISNFFEFDVNADFYSASKRSFDRDFTDELGFPLLHDSRLSILPVTVGFRVLPAGRYARRGAEGKRYVRRPAPYFGAGIGMAYWEYEEEGDFVFEDPDAVSGFSIFYDRVKDSGMAFEKHANVGIEIPAGREWNVTIEVRHSWLEANLSDAFPSAALATVPPEKLDLGGTSVFLGGSLRF